jgi:NAD(P)-dependent dehydrogenase (short-subunit alcohol dehydrogenase family)
MLVGANVFQQIFRLDGKVAVVTGAGSGFGRTFAQALADFGATVVCAGRRIEAVQQTASAITQGGGRAAALKLDVTDESSVEAFWHSVAAEHGRADILVNNAGIALAPQRTHEASVSDWDTVVATNLRGVFLTTRLALRQMLPGPGSIINIASIAGMRGYWPGFPSLAGNYAASKMGVVGFTRQVAAEYAREKIRVNAITPGWHGGTDLIAARRAVTPPEAIERFETELRRRLPMGRRGTPEDLAGLVVYLASDASSYVTGQVISHDGGWDATIV